MRSWVDGQYKENLPRLHPLTSDFDSIRHGGRTFIPKEFVAQYGRAKKLRSIYDWLSVRASDNWRHSPWSHVPIFLNQRQQALSARYSAPKRICSESQSMRDSDETRDPIVVLGLTRRAEIADRSVHFDSHIIT